jgi:predicted transcriptional regulator
VFFGSLFAKSLALELIENGLIDRDNENHYFITSKGEKYVDVFKKLQAMTDNGIVMSVLL